MMLKYYSVVLWECYVKYLIWCFECCNQKEGSCVGEGCCFMVLNFKQLVESFLFDFLIKDDRDWFDFVCGVGVVVVNIFLMFFVYKVMFWQ